MVDIVFELLFILMAFTVIGYVLSLNTNNYLWLIIFLFLGIIAMLLRLVKKVR
ncbi:AtpZ/AtpI family protein [Methanocaldococcus villosus]|uniref:AtpZ/AtpI family protein n=1 Tax=Methanocaldococcus villosus TaxID=667126 RepID=UPI00036B1F04|nr:AtpZ/AtpI family protein [Methanocaldococcus villosus]